MPNSSRESNPTWQEAVQLAVVVLVVVVQLAEENQIPLFTASGQSRLYLPLSALELFTTYSATTIAVKMGSNGVLLRSDASNVDSDDDDDDLEVTRPAKPSSRAAVVPSRCTLCMISPRCYWPLANTLDSSRAGPF